jgi:hypothetical protein
MLKLAVPSYPIFPPSSIPFIFAALINSGVIQDMPKFNNNNNNKKLN